ncbi:uncharacterized protein LOC133323026 [Musca vetustissima]|uniref:uncharacterized protein LOC133323026 n=1 Tax=Musca vetustissima TaxID=27455 RepID=UPI002AB5F4FF|nr:uncharacterized protein LOC133323026 [Musca vetustissima]
MALDLFLNFTFTSWHLRELNYIISGAHFNHDIQTLVYFGSPFDVETYIRAAEIWTTPKIVITEHTGEVHLKNDAGVNNNLFFVAIGNLRRRSFWNHMNNALSEMQSRVRGVFITTPPNGKRSQLNIGEHFEWCWQRGLINTLILVDHELPTEQRFQIFNYNPFLERHIFDSTNSTTINLFPDKFRNLHGYQIKATAQYDPPRVFERIECKGRKRQPLSGYVANIFRAFLKEYNASLYLRYYVPNKTLDIVEILQQINQGDVELSVNPYVPHKGIQLSYPIRMLRRCIVVPSAKELEKYKYFIMPFDMDVWLCFLGSWVWLSLTRLLNWTSTHRRCHCNHLDVGRTFLEVFRILTFLPVPGNCCSKSVRWYHLSWFVQVIPLAFILSNLYLASLTSFFSGLTFRSQISTLDELVKRNLAIDTIDYDIPSILENRGLPKGFTDILKPRSATDLLPEILELKPSLTFSALIDRIQFVLNQEKHLLKPTKHVVEECINTVPFGFVMPPHSQFELPLNRFLMRCAAAGLIEKWARDSIDDGYCTGMLTLSKSDFQVARPLLLEHFQFGWYVLGGGYTLSLLAFVLENCKRILRRFRIFIIYY